MATFLHFEDLKVGDRWESYRRTVTETDIVNFASLTGDFDPLHVDHHYAATTAFGKPIAHGLLGLSFLAGMGVHFPSVRTLAFVEIKQWKFLLPIFVGDTVYAANEISAIEPKGRRGGKVTWKRQLINQAGEVVQEGILETLVAKKQPADLKLSA
jgi:acyl dehydratase